MFYGDAQQELLKFMNSLKYLFESYQIVAEKGAKALVKTRKKDLGKQIADQTKAQMALEQKVKSLGALNPQPFVLDASLVKISLQRFATQP
jgi:hypothetical protein